jgi:hypothetical protein
MTANSSCMAITVSDYFLSIHLVALSYTWQCVGVEVVD